MSNKPPAGWKDYTVFLILLTLACAFIDRAEAYEYNGEKWMSRIDWYMGAGCPSYVKGTVEEVAKEIEANVAAIETRYVTKWSGVPAQDQRTTFYCGTTDVQESYLINLPWWLEMNTAETVAGRARWYYKESNNEIVECDVWLNTDELTEGNVEKFVRHELAHCLGLRHSNEYSAVMYYAPLLPYYHVDDWAGLKRLYHDCTPVIDKYLNLYIGAVETTEGMLSGILRAGKQWYADVYNVEEVECL